MNTFDRAGLLGLVADLYAASGDNRRSLESRLLGDRSAIEQYRRRIVRAIHPDPFSSRPISVRDANAAITQYQRATGDPAGAVDLMLSFVEAGTEQSVDLGYSDDAYFSALERKLDAIADLLRELPAGDRAGALRRLERVRQRARDIGWGYGDHVEEVVRRIQHRDSQRGSRRPTNGSQWVRRHAAVTVWSSAFARLST